MLISVIVSFFNIKYLSFFKRGKTMENVKKIEEMIDEFKRKYPLTNFNLMGNKEKESYVFLMNYIFKSYCESSYKDLCVDCWKKLSYEYHPLKLYKYYSYDDFNLYSFNNQLLFLLKNDCLKKENVLCEDLNFKIEEIILDYDNNINKVFIMLMESIIDEIMENYSLKYREIIKLCFNSRVKNNTKNYKEIIEDFAYFLNGKDRLNLIDETRRIQKIVNNQKFKDNFVFFLKMLLDLNKINKSIYTCRFSEKYFEDSLWSDDANNGDGFCLEYDLNEFMKQDALFLKFVPLLYFKKRTISLRTILEKIIFYYDNDLEFIEYYNTIKNLIISFMFVNQEQYSSENEWKILLNSQINHKDCISFKCIKSIYLGDKLSEEKRNKLISIAQDMDIAIFMRKKDNNGSFNYFRILN